MMILTTTIGRLILRWNWLYTMMTPLLSKRFQKMGTLMTALSYEADLEETVNELVQYKVIRTLLPGFGFTETGVSFLFACMLG